MAKKLNKENSSTKKKKASTKRVIHKSPFSRIRPYRAAKRPDRFGLRLSSINHDDFFNEILQGRSNQPTSDVENDDNENTTTATSSASTSQFPNESIEIEHEIIDSAESNETIDISHTSSQSGKSKKKKTFEEKVLEYLKRCDVRLTQLEKHVAKIDARLAAAPNPNFGEHASIHRREVFVCQQMDSSDQDELMKFGLPINSLLNLRKIEKDLENKQTFTEVQRILQKIGGVDGKGNGPKVLEPLVHSIVEPKMLANISWTGRGKGNEKKIPMSSHVNIIRLITSLCEKADSSYLPEKCTRDIKYKILKYAHSKYSSKDEESDCIIS